MAPLSHETLTRQKMAQQSRTKYVAQDYFCDVCAEKRAQQSHEMDGLDFFGLVEPPMASRPARVHNVSLHSHRPMLALPH
jgi:hypothetical protein